MPDRFLVTWFMKSLQFLLLLVAVLAALAVQAQGTRRVALVIGNAAYADAPLRNPVNDARLMESTLQRLGFDVDRVENADFKGLRRAIRDFGTRAAGADVALVFYAGHGMQEDGENYLMPIGAQIDKPADLAIEAISANALLRQVESVGARVALVVLDACRNSPMHTRTRSVSRGLARMNAPTGSIVAYAAQPGAVADDGDGANGLYTSYLARYLLQPGLDIKQVFEQTAIAVERDSRGRQRPREDIGLRGAFSLTGPAVTAPVPAATVQPAVAPATGISLPAITPPRPVAATEVASADLLVRLGHVGPTSGAIGHLGKDNELGMRLAVEELNARGVVIGGQRARFELLAEDDAGDPRQALSAAQKLVAARVNGVVGHLNSGTSIPASKVYSDAGIPQISPSATNPRFTRLGYRTSFRMVADDSQLARTMGAMAVKTLKGHAVAVIDDRTAYGAGIAGEFGNGVEALGGKVVAREYTNDKATDFTSIVVSLLAKNPDIVFFGGMDSVGGPLLQQLVNAGWRGRFLGGDGICSGEFPKLAGGRVVNNQVICAEAGGVEGDYKRRMDDFKARFREKFRGEVQIYAPYVYDAANVMVAAMVKAGSADPVKYLPVLAKTSGYQGVTGPISFDEKGDLVNGALTLFTYRDGRREQLAVVR